VEEESDPELLRRFAEHRDESAFEAIVRRHGPMVLGVCQRILSHRQDAEDAFQATFLVLVQKASSLRQPELLASWLYVVAGRIARKAKNSQSRRVQQEPSAMSTQASPDPRTEAEWRELLSIMDEELQQLPSKYRQPLVLCYLGNMTNEEAAEKLGWPLGSMSYRLARAREMLQKRLQKRNRSLPAGYFAGMALPLALPQVSGELISTTVSLAKALSASTAGAAAGAASSAAPVQMALTTLRAMALEKRKILIASAVAVLLAVFGLGVIVSQFFAGEFGQRPANNYYMIKGSSVPAGVFCK
jgi:RNA polymerase sigma factor (sigma-70 family)